MKLVSAAFVKAQKNFAPAIKGKVNPHFKSSYADLQTCISAVIDALNEQGIALMQVCHECESGVTVETVFVHESGEQLSGGKLHVPANKQDPQQYGSALTYCRRYSLQAAAGFAQEDDDGNSASKKIESVEKKHEDKVMTEEAIQSHIKKISTANNGPSIDSLATIALEIATKFKDRAAYTRIRDCAKDCKAALEQKEAA